MAKNVMWLILNGVMVVDDKEIKEVRDAYREVYEANMEMHNAWKEHLLFSWEWWLAVFLTILPWVVWFIFRKKESTDRLMYAGFFMILISSWLDFLGVVYGMWIYYVDVYYSIPPHVLWDFSVIPVTVMLLIQIKPHFSPLLKGIIFASLGVLGELVFEWLEFYEPTKWRIAYSFPIYIILYLISHYLTRRTKFALLTED